MRLILIGIFGILLFPSSPLVAQSLEEILEELEESIGTVIGSKSTLEQRFSYDEDDPYRLRLKRLTINAKGKSKEEVFEFNLADIDPNQIKRESKRDVALLNVRTQNKMKTIRVFEDGDQENYTNFFFIATKDPDQSKKFEKLLERAIPFAKELDNVRLEVPAFEDKIEWLKKNIRIVSFGKETVHQDFTQEGERPIRFRLEITKSSKRNAPEEHYLFNLADLQAATIELDVSGKEVTVAFETKRKQKFIEVFENGERENYQFRGAIYARSTDQARDMAKVLRELVPQAEEKLQESVPVLENLDTAMNLTRQLINKVEGESTVYEQSFSGGCIGQIQVAKEERGKQIKQEVQFNFRDLNAQEVNSVVSRNELAVEVRTNNKRKLVRIVENGLLSEYDDALSIQVAGVESGRLLAHALKKTIEFCMEKDPEPIFEADKPVLPKLASFIEDQEKAISEYEQTIELVEEECKLKFTLITQGRTTTEEIFEFSLKDIDPNNLDFLVKNKTLFVEVNTRHREKVIKYYEDGEVGNYRNQFQIYAEDVEVARSIIEGIKRLAEECGS